MVGPPRKERKEETEKKKGMTAVPGEKRGKRKGITREVFQSSDVTAKGVDPAVSGNQGQKGKEILN